MTSTVKVSTIEVIHLCPGHTPMQLTELISNFDLQTATGQAADANWQCDRPTSDQTAALDITAVTDDSRRCIPGCLFVARNGTDADGAQFISAAIDNGAAAVLCDRSVRPGDYPDITTIHPQPDAAVDNRLLGRLAERFYGEPSKKLKLIGVTGTNGKTTIAHLIQQLLAAEGLRVGLIGTVILDDGAEQSPATLTTPGAAQFSQLLAQMVANGCHAAVAEVSSHALDQDRAAALDFDVAVFSNLTQDHLDYHLTMDAYAAAKAKLFAALNHHAAAVINIDDPCAKYMLDATEQSGAMVVGCSLKGDRRAVCCGEVMQLQPQGCRASFDGPWGLTELTLPMVGEHNVCNALLAAAAAQQVADLTESIDHTLAHCKAVPGRLETVPSKDQTRPTVVVDYAHTPDALENVLKALRKVSPGKLVVMFGCGGDRDRAKRPLMGEIATRLADRVVVTSDNPRTEDPQSIIDDILQGIDENQRSKVSVQPDRGKAISLAIEGTDESPPRPTAADVVLLAGKGHEDYQVIGREKIWFDDRVVAAKVLEKINK